MAKNAIVKISARAKKIRSAHPSLTWKAAIKKASAEYRAGKLGKATGNDSSRGAGHTSTSTKANTTGNRTSTGTKTITAHVKIGKAKKYRQTGTSSKVRDAARHAKSPGKRIVKHKGKKSTSYTERRKNRSDKPGSLTGAIGNATAYQTMILNRIKLNNHYRDQALRNIERYKINMKEADKLRKLAYKRAIENERKNIKALTKDTSMLKTLLR